MVCIQYVMYGDWRLVCMCGVMKAATTQTALLSVGKLQVIKSVKWHATTCSVTVDNVVDSASLNTTSHAVNCSLVIIIILTLAYV